jgi:hypothetical protein
MEHKVSIDPSTVTEVPALSIPDEESRNPWISEDGLRMYFAVKSSSSPSRIYFTRRPSTTTQQFTSPMMVSGLNSTDDGDDGRPWLTQDEQKIVLPIRRSGKPSVLMTAIRSDGGFGTPTTEHLMAVNDFLSGGDHNDPFLSPDGRHLYLDADADPDPMHQQFQLLIATLDGNGDFGSPSQVPGTDKFNASLSDPVLYQEESLLVFSSVSSAGGKNDQLWYATLAEGAFGPPSRLFIDPDFADKDIVLTANGCELYFASTRNYDSGLLHIFHAPVTIAK